MGLDLKDLTKNPIKKENEEPKEKKNIIDEAAQNLLEKREEKRRFNQDPIFLDIVDDSKTTMKSNGVFMTVTPMLSSVIAPAVLLFSMDLQQEQLSMMWAVLIANIVAMIINSVVSYFNLKDAVSKTNRNAFRAVKSDYEMKMATQENKIKELEYKLDAQTTLINQSAGEISKQGEELEKLQSIKYAYDLEKAVEKEMAKKKVGAK